MSDEVNGSWLPEDLLSKQLLQIIGTDTNFSKGDISAYYDKEFNVLRINTHRGASVNFWMEDGKIKKIDFFPSTNQIDSWQTNDLSGVMFHLQANNLINPKVCSLFGLKPGHLIPSLTPRGDMIKPISSSFNPANDSEKAIATMLRSVGTEVVGIANGGSHASPDAKKLYLNVSAYATSTLFHESVHIWLTAKKWYSNEYLDKMPADLKTRGAAIEYKTLTSTVVRIFESEAGISPKERTALERALGKPEFYSDINKPDTDLIHSPYGESIIGNLVDESVTLGRVKAGHPMQNFHEFCASTLTTLTFDGQKFFENLAKLKELSVHSENSAIQAIYKDVITLLRASQKIGAELIVKFKETGNFEEVANLEINLAKLNSFLVAGNLSKPQKI